MSLDSDSSAYRYARERYFIELERVVAALSVEIDRLEHLPIPTFDEWLAGNNFPDLSSFRLGGDK